MLLAEYGCHVQPINHPTVPRGIERLRFTPGPADSDETMRELADALSKSGAGAGGLTCPRTAKTEALDDEMPNRLPDLFQRCRSSGDLLTSRSRGRR